MTVRANKFTPEVLLSAPRRSAGVPNADGTIILYTTSSYSFFAHEKTTELRSLDANTNESILLASSNDISEPVWLNDEKDVFICLKSGDKGSTSIIVSKATSESDWDKSYTAGTIEGPASSVKITKLEDGKFAIVLAAQSYPDGSLYNPETAPKTQSTGKLFKTLFVRHWDHYICKERNSLWYGTLTKKKEGKYELSPLINALKGLPLESPTTPFGGTDNFDVGKHGIIFVSKDPSLNPALNTKCNAYYISLSSFTEDPAPKPLTYSLPGFQGASSAPVISPDGKKAVFLSMITAGYEADKPQIILIEDVKKDAVTRLLRGDKGEGRWDRSPQNLCFSPDGETLYLSVEEEGYGRLFSLSADPAKDDLPRRLTEHGYVTDIRPLDSGRIFLSSTSLVDYTYYSIISHETASVQWKHSATKEGTALGLKASQVSSILTPSCKTSVNKTIHSWVLRPSTYSANSSKKYPLALLIHGGPQGAWGDSWSTRWNPAIFAEQGYIVVCPNPTGSTGYGQAFTDAIKGEWGGAPYEEIVNVFDWISHNMPEVDTDRAVALGASYGGYMMNWIQGHDLGRKFKTLVCHDGIFSTVGLLSTEELYFPFHDLKGTPWQSHPSNPTANSVSQTFCTQPSLWQKNDPSRFLDQWDTPALIIHNSKDYRLPISEGLAAFNVLQARGVESQFLTFPDENHWVLKPENSLVWHKVVLNWINRHVGLDAYCEEEGEELLGGFREGEVVGMVGMGKVET